MNIETSGLSQNNNEELRSQMKEAVEMLKDVFNIKDLSNNELFIIKKITEDVIKRLPINNTKGTDLAIINPSKEICMRFLIEAYGIDARYIEEHKETDEDMAGFLEYIRRTRERAHLI